MQDVRYVTVGKIVNTHGNRGMLRVMPLTDFPDRFYNMDAILALRDNTRRTLHIEKVFNHKRFIVIKFREIPDMNEAEKLKGAYLQIYRDQLTELPEDTFYIFQIVGCKVFTTEEKFLGKVTDVIQTGANDVYVVEREDKRKPLLIPALKSVVRNVSLKAGRIDVTLPEGLED